MGVPVAGEAVHVAVDRHDPDVRAAVGSLVPMVGIGNERQHAAVGAPHQVGRSQVEVADEAQAFAFGRLTAHQSKQDGLPRPGSRVGGRKARPVALKVHPVEGDPLEAVLVPRFELGPGPCINVHGEGNLLQRRHPAAVGTDDSVALLPYAAGNRARIVDVALPVGLAVVARDRVSQHAFLGPPGVTDVTPPMPHPFGLGGPVARHRPELGFGAVVGLDRGRNAVQNPGAVGRDLRPTDALDAVVVLERQRSVADEAGLDGCGFRRRRGKASLQAREQKNDRDDSNSDPHGPLRCCTNDKRPPATPGQHYSGCAG